MSKRFDDLRFHLKHLNIDLNSAFQKLNDGHVVELVRYLDQAKEKAFKLLEAVESWEE
jgi:hypothetical protein